MVGRPNRPSVGAGSARGPRSGRIPSVAGSPVKNELLEDAPRRTCE
ncbi:MAG: hypothetical protein QXR19_10885 [Candidatus Jordarchaeaceae archaeon]